MSRSIQRRRSGSVLRDRRVAITALGMLAVAVVAVTLQPQSSDAAGQQSDTAQLAAAGVSCQPPATSSGWRKKRSRPADCATGTAGGASSSPAAGGGQATPATSTDNAASTQATGSEPVPAQGTDPADTATPSTIVNPTNSQPPVGQQPADGATAPALGILGNTCEGTSTLPAHTGFQDGNRCVSTEFGEVGTADNNPSLIISSAPSFVRANQPFDLRVNTRNLVRDRFLAAAKGGYYKESSFLTADGLVRGHFHTACRTLTSRRTAPDPAPVPAFFAATEDGAGGRTPDTVTVRIPGLPAGMAQCAVWAGDGSHRIPMMQRANQIPAFDVVRIIVR